MPSYRLATSGSDTVTDDSTVKFLNIETIPEIEEWLNEPFIPGVFVREDPYDEVLPIDEWGRVAMFNQVLGGVSFEVTRMPKHACKTEKFLRDLYGVCTTQTSPTSRYLTTKLRLVQEPFYKRDWLNDTIKELLITIPTLNSEIPGYVVTTLTLDFKNGSYSYTTSLTCFLGLQREPSTFYRLIPGWGSNDVIKVFSGDGSFEKR